MIPEEDAESYEQDGSLQVAVKMQLYPGDEQVPAEWLMTVLAAFFPDAPFEDLPADSTA